VPAAGPDGTVFVLDQASRKLLVLPGAGAAGGLRQLADARAWGDKDFAPLDLMAFKEHLLVSGVYGKDALTTLTVLAQDSRTGRWKAEDPGIRFGPGEPFVFTPSGHLVLCDPPTSLKFYRNLRAPGESVETKDAGAETKGAAGEAKNQYVSRIPGGDAEKAAPERAGPQAGPKAPTGRPAPVAASAGAARRTPLVLGPWGRHLAGSARLTDPFRKCAPSPKVEFTLEAFREETKAVPAGWEYHLLFDPEIERTVRWMLAHTEQARQEGAAGPFLPHFGLACEPKGCVACLTIGRLDALAERIDADSEGEPLLVPALVKDLLGAEFRSALGIAGAPSGALAGDQGGNLLVGFGRSVGNLEPLLVGKRHLKQGRYGHKWAWIHQEAPAGADRTPEEQAAECLVPAFLDKDAYLLDPKRRMVFAMDHRDGKKRPVAFSSTWPAGGAAAGGFLPLDLVEHGGQLLVSGRWRAEDTPTLVVLAKEPSGAWGTRGLGVPIPGGRPCCFTPSGHLVTGDGAGGLLLHPNLRNEDRKIQAGAAFRKLVAEEQALETKKQPVSRIPGGDAERAAKQEAAAPPREQQKAEAAKAAPAASGLGLQPGPQTGVGGQEPAAPLRADDPADTKALPLDRAQVRRNAAAWCEAYAGSQAFPVQFGQWLEAMRERTPIEQPSFWSWLSALRAQPGPAAEPHPAQKAWGRYALAEPALEWAVCWMLRHAGQALQDQGPLAERVTGPEGRTRRFFSLKVDLEGAQAVLECWAWSPWPGPWMRTPEANRCWRRKWRAPKASPGPAQIAGGSHASPTA
jgi:hypothetical protein